MALIRAIERDEGPRDALDNHQCSFREIDWDTVDEVAVAKPDVDSRKTDRQPPGGDLPASRCQGAGGDDDQ